MLFEDPEFPAEDSSMFSAKKTSLFKNKEIIWKRPKVSNSIILPVG